MKQTKKELLINQIPTIIQFKPNEKKQLKIKKNSNLSKTTWHKPGVISA